MSKLKTKKARMFAMVMCAVVMVSSLAVFAGSTSSYFGAGESHATASLSCYSGNGTARTIPDSAEHFSLRTTLTMLSAKGNRIGSGGSEVNLSILPCHGAESSHIIDGICEYLTTGNS